MATDGHGGHSEYRVAPLVAEVRDAVEISLVVAPVPVHHALSVQAISFLRP